MTDETDDAATVADRTAVAGRDADAARNRTAVAGRDADAAARRVHHPDHARAAAHATRLGATLATWQSSLLYMVGVQLREGHGLEDAKSRASAPFRGQVARGDVDFTVEDIDAFLARVSAAPVLLR